MHVSTFMTQYKPGSATRCTIIGLSFPLQASVNYGIQKNEYLGTQWQLHYPPVDKLIYKLRLLGPAALIFKVDVSHAFRHIRIYPGDKDLLELKHRDSYCLDLALPFGFR